MFKSVSYRQTYRLSDKVIRRGASLLKKKLRKLFSSNTYTFI